ncbi:MAG: Trm112 family protein [Phycisphaerales bacterium]|nr:MAG: Trm112 family protein [Phycisphaerales bacterium]
MNQRLDPEFLKILVCPITKAPLIQRGEWLYSTDSANRKKYPIRDGIPVMLVEEAIDVDEEEFLRAKDEVKDEADQS